MFKYSARPGTKAAEYTDQISEEVKQSRLILSKEKRSFKPCVNCDVKGDIMGYKNYLEWEKYYGK